MDEAHNRHLHSPLGTIDHPKPPAVLHELAEQAGVQINGNAPWDFQVHDPAVYTRILTSGSLGFGESYMDGMWDCDALDKLFYRLLSARIDEQLGGWVRLRLLGMVLSRHLFNHQKKKRAFQVGRRHYDIGNDVFAAMLDPTMSYSCGYWQNANTLEQAQLAKLDLICRKLELKPGDKLLDIGCGWGGLAQYAAIHYGAEVVGITVSREQQKLAAQRCAALPITIELIDYRDIQGSFDKVVSVGMFEHVGLRNYPVYFDTVSRLMKANGLFLLHTIGSYKSGRGIDPWLNKHIFPNSKLPSAEELSAALDGRFIIEDWHTFGQDYDRTLMAWWERFDAAWPTLKTKYGEQFYRMWKYYLLSCAGFFRSRQGQLWQLVLSKYGPRPIYRSVR